MGKNCKSALILLSGGIDSTACIHYYLDGKFDVKAVFLDYGQKARVRELSSAKKIAKHYRIEFNKIALTSSNRFSSGEIRGRNAFLIFAVLMHYQELHGIISLGVHSGTPYYDCSESFVKNINETLNGYTSGRVLLDTPFLKWNKKMLYDYCKINDVPTHLTYSCENGLVPPCGRCLSCKDRSALDVS